jgi:hypothetical protein
VLRALREAVGGWCGRGLVGHALGLLLYSRLAGICGRMERMIARFEAGRLWRRTPVVGIGRAEGTGVGRRVERIWPCRFGWLVRLASWQAAGFGAQLRAVLETPEMVALLIACPQAGRVLLPICRMLSVERSVLRLQGGRRRVRVAAADIVEDGESGRIRVRPARKAVVVERIPLPRGVLSAARRQGFGRVG